MTKEEAVDWVYKVAEEAYANGFEHRRESDRNLFDVYRTFYDYVNRYPYGEQDNDDEAGYIVRKMLDGRC